MSKKKHKSSNAKISVVMGEIKEEENKRLEEELAKKREEKEAEEKISEELDEVLKNDDAPKGDDVPKKDDVLKIEDEDEPYEEDEDELHKIKVAERLKKKQEKHDIWVERRPGVLKHVYTAASIFFILVVYNAKTDACSGARLGEAERVFFIETAAPHCGNPARTTPSGNSRYECSWCKS